MAPDRPEDGHRDILVYDASGAGHRANYVRIFAGLTGGTGLVAPLAPAVPRLLATRRLVLTTLETAPKRFLLILWLRSLLGRRSAVVSLRAHLRPARGLTGRLAMRLLKRLRSVLKLSLVPVDAPGGESFGFVAIRDPECWDLLPEDRTGGDTALSAAVRRFAGARKLLILPGNLNPSKGMNFVRDIFCGDPALFGEVVPVLCGPVEPDGKAAAAELEAAGAFVEARYLERGELMSLYRAADGAWCCYPPERDLSSGIFGRAVQFGITPVVRQGSVLDRMAADVPNALRLDFADPAGAGRALAAGLARITPPQSRLEWESEALGGLLLRHFGLDPPA
jgi:hypothetical protein